MDMIKRIDDTLKVLIHNEMQNLIGKGKLRNSSTVAEVIAAVTKKFENEFHYDVSESDMVEGFLWRFFSETYLEIESKIKVGEPEQITMEQKIKLLKKKQKKRKP